MSTASWNSPDKTQIQDFQNLPIAKSSKKVQFSFLNQNDYIQKGKQLIQTELEDFISQLKQININLTKRMNRMNEQIEEQIEKYEDKKTKQNIKSQLYHAGKQFYNPRGLVGISTDNEDMFSVKKHLIENKHVETPSNFEIDENQNFIKMKLLHTKKEQIQSKIAKPLISVTNIQKIPKQKAIIPDQQLQEKPKQKRRIYQSVLSKFTTANLIAMNKLEN